MEKVSDESMKPTIDESINAKPIAVVDSGLGGLTVAKNLRARLPNENIVYLGDNARLPYGEKSPEDIILFSQQIIQFLMVQNVKYVVVACNTLSSIALNVMKETSLVPVVGVIEPTISHIKNFKVKDIGVIATRATIANGIYERSINQSISGSSVYSKATPSFVPLIEQGCIDEQTLNNAIEKELGTLKTHKIDALVLGCTHYTIIEKSIKRYFKDKVNIINTSDPVINYIERDLREKKLLQTGEDKGNIKLYFSDSGERYKMFFEDIFEVDAVYVEENIDITMLKKLTNN